MVHQLGNIIKNLFKKPPEGGFAHVTPRRVEAYSFSTPLQFSHDYIAQKYSKAFRLSDASKAVCLLGVI